MTQSTATKAKSVRSRNWIARDIGVDPRVSRMTERRQDRPTTPLDVNAASVHPIDGKRRNLAAASVRGARRRTRPSSHQTLLILSSLQGQRQGQDHPSGQLVPIDRAIQEQHPRTRWMNVGREWRRTLRNDQAKHEEQDRNQEVETEEDGARGRAWRRSPLDALEW